MFVIRGVSSFFRISEKYSASETFGVGASIPSFIAIGLKDRIWRVIVFGWNDNPNL
jgi:hypothetical protein